MSEAHEARLLCFACKVELIPKRVEFSYLGHSFAHQVLRCPVCGQVFISEKLAKGRMAEVEMELEDK